MFKDKWFYIFSQISCVINLSNFTLTAIRDIVGYSSRYKKLYLTFPNTIYVSCDDQVWCFKQIKGDN